MKGECLCDDCDYETCLCSKCDSSDDCKDGDACNYAPEKPKRASVEENKKAEKEIRQKFAFGEGGMTLRDYFAGQVLEGLTFCNVTKITITDKFLSSKAYAIADAMLAEREKKNGKDNC